MQRVQDPTASAALVPPPALTGPIGFFQPAVPGITAATRYRYWIANMLQEELMSILAAAGVAPDTTGTEFTGVLRSIEALIAAKVPLTGSWIDQTASRALNTTYTNSTGEALAVSVNVISVSSTGQVQIFYVGALQVVQTQLGGTGGGSGGTINLSAIVPAGATYRLASSIAAIVNWLEMA
jgi:hypothetical protein